MKTKTIESLQRRFKAKGFDPGPIDGIDGPWTFARTTAGRFPTYRGKIDR